MAKALSPDIIYSSLLSKITTILEITQRPQGSSSPQAKQELLQATNELKQVLSRCKDYAYSLPGGELRTGDQDVVIAMLEGILEQKRQLLGYFHERTHTTASPVPSPSMKLDLDSVASTPFGQAT